MYPGVCAAIVAAFAIGSGAVWAACPPDGSRNCINLDLAPQISQRNGADERTAPPARRTTEAVPSTPYSGPIVGLSPTVRPTPTLGYRWALE